MTPGIKLVTLLGNGRPTLAKIIAALFPASEEGAIYETDPITSMYQESTGVTAAVVGQPVGLALDKRLWLVPGAELVTNPGPFVVTTGYAIQGTGALVVDTARLKITQLAAWNDGVLYAFASDAFAASTQLLTITVDTGTSGLVQVQVGNGTYGNGGQLSVVLPASGTYTYRIPAFIGGAGITVKAGDISTFYISAMSVKALPGNHALQATSAARSVLTAYGAINGDMYDGFDDSKTCSTGAGGTTGFFWCGAVRVLTVGAVQTLWSDTGTNTGYRVRLNASNQLELAAGNNVAYTTANTVPTVSVNTNYVLTVWHDGVNLNAQINLGAVGQAAFVTTTAGTAGFTRAKDNGAASNFSNHAVFAEIYKKNANVSATHRAMVQKYVASKGGVQL